MTAYWNHMEQPWERGMATIAIKGIPDDVYEHLDQSAAAHRRSINSEVIVCLERT